MLGGAPLVEHFAGPSAKRFGAEGKQPMELLQESRKDTPYVGDDFVGVGAHQATGVHDDTEALCRQTEAVPVATLELTGLIGIEEKVAPGGAARERPGRTGLNDASSGHARGRSEKRADGGGVFLQGWRPWEVGEVAEWQSPPAGASLQQHRGIAER